MPPIASYNGHIISMQHNCCYCRNFTRPKFLAGHTAVIQHMANTHSYTVYGLYEKSSFRRRRLLQRHTTHVMQKANRHMSMAATAPPPAAPMMMYRSSLSSITLSPGTVAALAMNMGRSYYLAT